MQLSYFGLAHDWLKIEAEGDGQAVLLGILAMEHIIIIRKYRRVAPLRAKSSTRGGKGVLTS